MGISVTLGPGYACTSTYGASTLLRQSLAILELQRDRVGNMDRLRPQTDGIYCPLLSLVTRGYWNDFRDTRE